MLPSRTKGEIVEVCVFMVVIDVKLVIPDSSRMFVVQRYFFVLVL